MASIIHASIGAPHPECEPDEVFVSYANECGASAIGWTTKRTGTRVFDTDGHEVTGIVPDLVPVFAKRRELSALLH